MNMKLYLRKPQKIFRALGSKNFLNWVPDKLYLKILFWAEVGKKLDLKNPQTFNEKLQWLKIYNRKPEYSMMVDKYEVRKYIAEKIGEEYLIPLLKLYNNVEEIEWESLPEKFVLKCTHGSHSNIICEDKSKLDIEKSKQLLNKWMKMNWFWFGREWPYKNVKPRIIVEEYMEDTASKGKGLKDYKVMCFNGKAEIIEVHNDRFGEEHTQDFYDKDWKKTEISQEGTRSDFLMEKPVCFEQFLKLSEILAEGIPHVRVDWYIINGKLYFGEITFFDGSGLSPFDKAEYDLYLGKLINLNDRR